MTVYVVTGKLGGGKSLCCVRRIEEYILQGRRIATNLDLFLVPMLGIRKRDVEVVRLPDKPSIFDLECIGTGNDSYDEEKNGLLVLDECGTWFNTRSWNEKGRAPVIDWFLHARKNGWDVLLIIQDISMLDSQARAAIAEHTVFCRRLDRLKIPFVTSIVQTLTGIRIKPPKLHMARVVYGTSDSDLLVDRWVTFGTRLYSSFDTKQKFRSDYPHGPYSMLTPWHLKGRYFKLTWRKVMQIAKVVSRKKWFPVSLAMGCVVGVMASALAWPLVKRELETADVESPPVGAALSSAMQNLKQSAVASDPAALGQNAGILSGVVDGGAEVVPVTVAQRFAPFSIVAHVRGNGQSYYQVRGPEGAVFTDAQLRAMGYRVFGVSECELMVVAAETWNDKATIWQPGCMVRDENRTPVDLQSVPMLSKGS